LLLVRLTAACRRRGERERGADLGRRGASSPISGAALHAGHQLADLVIDLRATAITGANSPIWCSIRS
jgi:hypothetical protein